jgi:hypothetical protein
MVAPPLIVLLPQGRGGLQTTVYLLGPAATGETTAPCFLARTIVLSKRWFNIAQSRLSRALSH